MAAEASVSLRGVWVHDADDLSRFVFLEAFGVHGRTTETGTEVRPRAGGRMQAVTSARRAQVVPVECPFVDRATWEQLEEWTGTLVMVRDPRSRLQWGVYADLMVEDRTAPESAISFELRAVTHQEGV